MTMNMIHFMHRLIGKNPNLIFLLREKLFMRVVDYFLQNQSGLLLSLLHMCRDYKFQLASH